MGTSGINGISETVLPQYRSHTSPPLTRAPRDGESMEEMHEFTEKPSEGHKSRELPSKDTKTGNQTPRTSSKGMMMRIGVGSCLLLSALALSMNLVDNMKELGERTFNSEEARLKVKTLQQSAKSNEAKPWVPGLRPQSTTTQRT